MVKPDHIINNLIMYKKRIKYQNYEIFREYMLSDHILWYHNKKGNMAFLFLGYLSANSLR